MKHFLGSVAVSRLALTALVVSVWFNLFGDLHRASEISALRSRNAALEAQNAQAAQAPIATFGTFDDPKADGGNLVLVDSNVVMITGIITTSRQDCAARSNGAYKTAWQYIEPGIPVGYCTALPGNKSGGVSVFGSGVSQ